MAKRERSAVESYHDRVAGIYDTIYEGNPYWETVSEITWRHITRHLPRDLSSRCLDVGCGTGKWGLKLLKSGYRTDFLDISQKMLDQVAHRLARIQPAPDPAPALLHLSVDDLSSLPAESYDVIVGQGDPLCSARRPERALKQMTRLLAPGGILIQSVDNRLAGIRHFFQEGDLDGLERFLKDGRTRWVTDEEAERFDLTMFAPEDIRKLCAARGLELVSLIGKTALPLRRYQDLLRDGETRRRLVRLEERLHGREAMLGVAAHLEFVARKPAAED
jgi:SAM-dependent methyltransferase